MFMEVLVCDAVAKDQTGTDMGGGGGIGDDDDDDDDDDENPVTPALAVSITKANITQRNLMEVIIFNPW